MGERLDRLHDEICLDVAFVPIVRVDARYVGIVRILLGIPCVAQREQIAHLGLGYVDAGREEVLVVVVAHVYKALADSGPVRFGEPSVRDLEQVANADVPKIATCDSEEDKSNPVVDMGEDHVDEFVRKGE